MTSNSATTTLFTPTSVDLSQTSEVPSLPSSSEALLTPFLATPPLLPTVQISTALTTDTSPSPVIPTPTSFWQPKYTTETSNQLSTASSAQPSSKGISEHTLSTESWIGIGVGCGVVVIATTLYFIIVCLWWRRQWNIKTEAGDEFTTPPLEDAGSNAAGTLMLDEKEWKRDRHVSRLSRVDEAKAVELEIGRAIEMPSPATQGVEGLK